MLRQVTRSLLPALADGAVAIGSGGGGDPRPLVGLVAGLLDTDGVQVTSAAQLAPDALVAPLVIMGSTLVMQEKLPSGREIPAAFAALHRWLGCEITAVIPLEVAGVNALVAIAAAAHLGVPLLDGDLAGRALPRLDQFTPALCGMDASPCVLADPGGAVTVIDGASWRGAEAALRGQVAGSGGWGLLVCPPLTASQALSAAIPGGYSRAVHIGRALAALPGDASPRDVAVALGGQVVGHGRVTALRPGPDGTHSVVVRTTDGGVVRVEADTEYVAAFRSGQLMAACPQIITLINPRSREMPGPRDVRPGHDIAVVALPGSSWWSAHLGPGGIELRASVPPTARPWSARPAPAAVTHALGSP